MGEMGEGAMKPECKLGEYLRSGYDWRSFLLYVVMLIVALIITTHVFVHMRPPYVICVNQSCQHPTGPEACPSSTYARSSEGTSMLLDLALPP